jgi:molybdate transport system ATP-binding protein
MPELEARAAEHAGLAFELAFSRGDFRLDAKARIGSGVTGIFGPSGCGKSTLLALLAGLLRPHTGYLRFADEVLVDVERHVHLPAWQRHFGLVFQEGLLFPHLSVKGNLLYGFRRQTAGPHSVDFQHIVDLLQIAPLLSRRPVQLSGGERQRVALGRALLSSPRLLMLDEPLSSLDEQLKQQSLPYLARVKEEARVPMIYVSHARAELDYLADRVLTMEAGRLAG